MWKFICTSFATVLFSNYVQAQNPVPITSVTLSPQGAIVVRTAEVSRGKSQVLTPALPEGLDRGAVHVEPSSSLVHIISVSVDSVQLSASEAADQKRHIEEKSVLQAKLRAADQTREYLRLQATTSGKTPADAKTIAATAEAIWNQSQKISDVAQATEAQIRTLDGILQKYAAKTRQKIIVVDVDASDAGQIAIHYSMGQAGWKQAYRAHLDSAGTKLLLESMAVLSQRTGEDWANVEVELTSESLRLPLRGPEPAPRKISLLPRATSTASAQSPTTDKSVLPKAEVTADAQQRKKLPKRLTLAAGQTLTVPVQHDSIDVTQSLRIVPRRDIVSTLFIRGERPASVKLPGELQLYRDGGLVGEPYSWNPVAEGVAFQYGHDPRLEGSLSTTPTVLDKAKQEFSDVITVRNKAGQPLNALIIIDAPINDVPKSKLERSFDPQPTSETWGGRKDMIAWERTLPAEQEAVFKANYVLVYPKPAATAEKSAPER
jgi:hypothetical protein